MYARSTSELPTLPPLETALGDSASDEHTYSRSSRRDSLYGMGVDLANSSLNSYHSDTSSLYSPSSSGTGFRSHSALGFSSLPSPFTPASPHCRPSPYDCLPSPTLDAIGSIQGSHASRGIRRFAKRATFSQAQLAIMEKLWIKGEYPSVEEVDQCARQTGLSTKQIRTW